MEGRKQNWSDSQPGFEDPISAAVTLRDEDWPALISGALRRQDYQMAFQPVVSGKAPDRVAYWEGQLRLFDPSGRAMQAAHYKQYVAGTELARKIDCAALELGMSALHERADLRLAINISARSVGYGPWIRSLLSWLGRDPTVGERLIMEVTERSAMLVPDLTASFMREFQPRGICFALDEFGSGAIELRHLRNFYFDIMKLHDAFVKGVHRDADNQVLIKAMIMIGHQYDMFTVAEHVEHQQDATWLVANGVDYLQGNLIAPPTLYPPWRNRAD